MTTRTRSASTAAVKKMLGLRTNALGFPALFAQSVALISPTMTAVLIIPLAFASAGAGHLAGLRLRHRDAALRGVLPQPVRQAIRLAGLDVRLHRPGPRPAPACFSGWTLIWSYLFIAVAGMCGFAVFCGQLLSALGYHGSVHPIFFFAISAVLCWFIAYKDIRVSSMLTLVLEGASVACILALACVVLFKHGFPSTPPSSPEGRRPPRHGPGRRGLHLLPGRLRERHRPRR